MTFKKVIIIITLLFLINGLNHCLSKYVDPNQQDDSEQFLPHP